MAKFTDEDLGPNLVQPCEEKEHQNPDFHWIEIEMVYEFEGEPVPGEEYCITLPDGAEVRGYLNKKGWAKVSFIQDPGNCQISFPGLDEEAWEPA